MTAAFLPLLYPVVTLPYVSGATDDNGNEIPGWGPPVERDAYGWGPPQLQTPKEVIVGTARYVVAVEMMVPPGFVLKDKDRVILVPLTDYVANIPAFDVYRVVGPTEDYSHNPFGWNPGNVINLVAVQGVTPP